MELTNGFMDNQLDQIRGKSLLAATKSIPRLYNIDRWAIYTWDGRKYPTPKQRRRMMKKMRKNNDYSL